MNSLVTDWVVVPVLMYSFDEFIDLIWFARAIYSYDGQDWVRSGDEDKPFFLLLGLDRIQNDALATALGISASEL